MKKIAFTLFLLLFLMACNTNSYSPEINFVNIATIENPNLNTKFYFWLDNDERMWTATTNLYLYRPKNGQRIIVNYSILTVKGDTSSYNHDVRVNDIYEVLTKGIFKIKPENQDSIGNDLISIKQMWIGSDYLNVEFYYPGYDKIHYINLVSDRTKTYTDSKVHLEFRHNDNNDNPTYTKSGIVSFNLWSLRSKATADSLNIVIHTHEFSSSSKTYNLTYKFKTSNPRFEKRKISFPYEYGRVY